MTATPFLHKDVEILELLKSMDMNVCVCVCVCIRWVEGLFPTIISLALLSVSFHVLFELVLALGYNKILSNHKYRVGLRSKQTCIGNRILKENLKILNVK